MSVTTTSDDKIAAAKEKLKEAHVLLHEAINPETWGASEFNADYRKQIFKSIDRITKTIHKL